MAVAQAEPQTRVEPVISTERTHYFRKDVEGLRAIAVVLVVLDHAGVAFVGGGFIGVDVFFVLSGFLITGQILRELESKGRISILQFYGRRARRLLPASTLVLVLTVVASYLWLGGARADRIDVDARWSALFASNFRFIQQGTDYFDSTLPASPLQHYWSLAVEEQFYAVWPLAMMLVALLFKQIPLRVRLGFALSAIVIGSALWSVHETTVDGTAAYFSPFTRASELAIGALVAVCAPLLVRAPSRLGTVASWLGLAAVLIAAKLFTANTIFPGIAVMLPVLGAALAVAGGSIAPEGGAEVLLKHQPFQWLGKISYSLYLWHWPILIIAAGYAGHNLSTGANLLLCLLAIAIAAVSYVGIENPVRNLKALRLRKPAFSIALGAALVCLSLGAATFFLHAQGSAGEQIAHNLNTLQFADEATIEKAVADAENINTWPAQPPRLTNLAYVGDCNVTRADTSSAACVFGDPNGDTSVVVYGDSHAAMWIPAFDIIGKQEGIKFIQLTKPGCPALDFTIYSQTLKREYSECTTFRSFALSKIAELNPDEVIISNAYQNVEESVDGKASKDNVANDWMSGLTSIIQQIQPNTGKIVVVGDMAYPALSGIDCLTAHPGNVAACNTPRSKAVDENHNQLEKQTTEAAGATYVDTIKWFCTDTDCPAVIGGITVHRDNYHIGENYAAYLAQPLGEECGLIPDGDTLQPVPIS